MPSRLAVTLTLVALLAGCGGDGGAPTTTTSGAPTATTLADGSTHTQTSFTSSTTTAVEPEALAWPGEAPERFALVTAESVTLLVQGTRQDLDIPNVRAGAIIDGQFLFAVEGVSGTWVWPPEAGLADADLRAPGGAERVGMLIGQAGTEVSTRYDAAAIVAGQPVVIYREIDTAVWPQTERLMLLELESGESRLLFDKATRRDGLTGEEREAFMAEVTVAGDMVAVLFGVGDSTWLEWYDLQGNPVADPFDADIIPGTVLEIAGADDLIVLGVEPEVHRLITEVMVVDLDSGRVRNQWTHDVAGHHLRNLEFDGRWVTAAIHQTDGPPIAVYLIDTVTGVSADEEVPGRIILEERG
jgi:hypothetical protein